VVKHDFRQAGIIITYNFNICHLKLAFFEPAHYFIQNLIYITRSKLGFIFSPEIEQLPGDRSCPESRRVNGINLFGDFFRARVNVEFRIEHIADNTAGCNNNSQGVVYFMGDSGCKLSDRSKL